MQEEFQIKTEYDMHTSDKDHYPKNLFVLWHQLHCLNALQNRNLTTVSEQIRPVVEINLSSWAQNSFFNGKSHVDVLTYAL